MGVHRIAKHSDASSTRDLNMKGLAKRDYRDDTKEKN